MLSYKANESLVCKRCLGGGWHLGIAQCYAYGCRKARRAMDEKCIRIQRLLDLYRAGKLREEEKAEVEYHLLYCPECIFLLTLVPSFSIE